MSDAGMPEAGLIAGRPAKPVPESEFTAWNVLDGTARAQVFAETTFEDVSAAVTAASAAFRESQLGTVRCAPAVLLRAIAHAVEARTDHLVETAAAETGLDAAVRLRGEVARTTGQMRLLANESLRRSGSAVAEDQGTKEPPLPALLLGEVPIGPVAVFGASNFPFAFGVLGGDTAAALAAGCPVVVKGHPAHPETSQLLGDIVTGVLGELGWHPGWFSLVHGRTERVGLALVTSPELEAVAFTGSTCGGLALSHAASSRPRPIPVYAEMGGINALYLLPGAAKESGPEFIAGLAASITTGSGQFCTKPGLLVLVDDAHGRAIVDDLDRTMSSLDSAPLLTSGTRAALSSGLKVWADTDGVRLLRGDAIELGSPGARVPGALATIDSSSLRANPFATDEIFGPALLVVLCTDEQDLLALVDAIPPGLTATVHGAPDDKEVLLPLLRRLRLRSGRVLFGGFPTGVRVGNATTHGGPFPATTASWSTSVGARALDRFIRPVTYQNLPVALRADALSWN